MTEPDNTDQPEQFDLRSHDIAADKQAALRAAFPEVFTEGGKIDFERLKLALGETVDAGKERYGMNWPGKSDCFKTIQQPSIATLVPVKMESVAWDTTENLIIEGDNLEVLKLLQKSYLSRVKVIYIDPPYNTGNDFIYPDNYAESLDTYLRYTGQVDSEGRKYSTNTEADGRFHSKWLNMMYPRLYLARNLLRDDGLVFISIDDAEVDNLRKLCGEVFGEENFVACIVWQKTYSPANDKKGVDAMHDFLICFQKTDAAQINLLPRTAKQDDAYSNQDNDPRGAWKAVDATRAEHRDYAFFPILTPSGKEVFPAQGRSWVFTKEEVPTLIADNRLWFGKDGSSKPSKKLFLTEVKQGVVPTTWWSHEDAGHNDEAKKELKALMTEGLPFETPKPTRLIQRAAILATASDKNDIVLDFFAGSGTTGHAMLTLNNQDGGNRQFILVQLPEPTGQQDFPTIADITKERVRRVIKKLTEEETAKNAEDAKKAEGELPLNPSESLSSLRSLRLNPDRGFKVFKLQSSNFKTWNSDVPKEPGALVQQLEMHIHHIVEGRTPEDLLFEILLKSGFPLTTPIETLTLAGQTVFSIAEGAMLICLEKKLFPEVIKEMAARKPERVVCLDEGFAGNDQLKTNAVQTMKTKGVTSFRTV
jgi:adenine-specific DNA-methyltransferase